MISQLLKAFIPDLKIVQILECGRNKTTGFLLNVIDPVGEKELIKVLKKRHFSIIFEESTDLSVTKYLVLMVRFYCGRLQKPTKGKLGIPVVNDASAYGLKKMDYHGCQSSFSFHFIWGL